jgi:hypothetical protein
MDRPIITEEDSEENEDKSITLDIHDGSIGQSTDYKQGEK